MIKKILTKPLVLVGMMGSGKSTVGRKLARKLNLQFYDSDKVIEDREALSIIDIHDFMGEKYFQQKEVEVIKEIIGYGVVVLSTGCSSFMNKTTRDFIKKHAISIWLDSKLETIYERVSRRNIRPELINASNKKELLAKMLQDREAVFQESDIKIKSDLEAHHLVSGLIQKLDSLPKYK